MGGKRSRKIHAYEMSFFGVYNKDAGKIYLDGEEINFKNSKEALEKRCCDGASGA